MTGDDDARATWLKQLLSEHAVDTELLQTQRAAVRETEHRTTARAHMILSIADFTGESTPQIESVRAQLGDTPEARTARDGQTEPTPPGEPTPPRERAPSGERAFVRLLEEQPGEWLTFGHLLDELARRGWSTAAQPRDALRVTARRSVAKGAAERRDSKTDRMGEFRRGQGR